MCVRISKKQSVSFIVVLIVCLAAILRVWGLPFGLPNLSRPDEQNISVLAVEHILNSFAQGQPDLNPHWFEYPSLYIYAVTLLYGLYYWVGSLNGTFPDWQAFLQSYYNDGSMFHLLSRSLTALCGVFTVLLVYALGKALTRSRLVGLVAAFLMAVTYLHVRDSHFGVTDVPATFWVTLTLWLSVRYYRQGIHRDLTWAAMAAGLAASTKYPAGVLLLSVLSSYIWGNLKAPRKTLLDGILSLCSMAFIGFFLGSPFIVMDFPHFWKDFEIQRRHLAVGHGLDLGLGWIYHLRFSLWYGVGPLYLLAALAGMAWALLKKQWYWGILLIFGGIYYLLMGSTHTVFVRYVIPLLPVFAVSAAWFIVKACHGLRQWSLKNLPALITLPQAVLVMLVTLLISWHSLSHSLDLDRLLAKADTRSLAGTWIQDHVNPGTCVGNGMYLPQVSLPLGYRKLFLQPEETGKPLEGRQFLKQQKNSYYPYDLKRNEWVITTYRIPWILNQLGCPLVVISKTPLTLFTTPAYEAEDVSVHYSRLAEFSAHSMLPPDETGNLPQAEDYDQLDAFYLPFTHFDGLERPGPEIEIYQVPFMNNPSPGKGFNH